MDVKTVRKQGQANQCQTLRVKLESLVEQFSNCMINLYILLTNLQQFLAIKMTHKTVSSKFPIKFFIKMSNQNVSSKCLIQISHQNVSLKFLIKISHQMVPSNVTSKCLVKMSH